MKCFWHFRRVVSLNRRNLSQLATILLYHELTINCNALVISCCFILDIDFFMKYGWVNCPKFWINDLEDWTNSSTTTCISTSKRHISTKHPQSKTDVDHNNYKINTNFCLVKSIDVKNLLYVMWHNRCYWCTSHQITSTGEVNHCTYLVHMSCGTVIVMVVHSLIPESCHSHEVDHVACD